jgi:hypothetical protein
MDLLALASSSPNLQADKGEKYDLFENPLLILKVATQKRSKIVQSSGEVAIGEIHCKQHARVSVN